jgi:uncharacterized protein (TIGR02147 family)
MANPDVFDYLDYRQFLNAFYRSKKGMHPYFSFRYMARKTGIDQAHIARVMQGKRHLTSRSLEKLLPLLQFNEKERAYFGALAAFNTARTDRETKAAYERLLALAGIDAHKLEPDQYAFYQTWRHTAVRTLIALYPFRAKEDAGAIAANLSPPITAKQVKESIHLLLRLGLIAADEKGILYVTDINITTGEKWRSAAIRSFQREMIGLARNSIDSHPAALRDISTVTCGISLYQLPELRKRIAEFRSSIIRLANENSEPEEVYQLNIQLFPLSKTSKGANA